DHARVEAELAVVGELALEVALGLAELLPALDRAVAAHEQDPVGAAVVAAVVVADRAAADLGHAVEVEVAEHADAAPELVVGVEVTREAAGDLADLVPLLHRTVAVQEEHVEGALVRAVVVV